MLATDHQSDQEVLQQFLNALPGALGNMDLVYQLTPLDSLHVWLLSDAFQGPERQQNIDLIYPVFRRLNPGILLRISLVFKMTPGEFEDEYKLALAGIPGPGEEDGSPGSRPESAAPEGVFRLTRRAG